MHIPMFAAAPNVRVRARSWLKFFAPLREEINE